MEESWKENLTKFKILQTRILYLIFYLFKTYDINYQEKCRLKQLVILEDERINKVFIEFEKTLNIAKLTEDFRLIYQEDKGKNDESSGKLKKNEIDVRELKIITNNKVLKNKAKMQQIIIEEIGSPVGTNLREIKQKRQKENVKKVKEDIPISIEDCEVGLSPKIDMKMFKKDNKNVNVNFQSYLGNAVLNLK